MTTIEAAQAARDAIQQRTITRIGTILRLSDVRSEEDDGTDGGVQPHRAADPADVGKGGGIRFQRCGGGRRIIRRQRASN